MGALVDQVVLSGWPSRDSEPVVSSRAVSSSVSSPALLSLPFAVSLRKLTLLKRNNSHQVVKPPKVLLQLPRLKWKLPLARETKHELVNVISFNRSKISKFGSLD